MRNPLAAFCPPRDVILTLAQARALQSVRAGLERGSLVRAQEGGVPVWVRHLVEAQLKAQAGIQRPGRLPWFGVGSSPGADAEA